jgi:hypothetical protein
MKTQIKKKTNTKNKNKKKNSKEILYKNKTAQNKIHNRTTPVSSQIKKKKS